MLEGTTAATHQLVMPEGGSWWPWRPLGSWRSSRPDPRVPLGVKDSSYVRVHGPRCQQGWGAGGPDPHLLALGARVSRGPGEALWPRVALENKDQQLGQGAADRRPGRQWSRGEPPEDELCIFRSTVRLVFS